MTHRYYPAATYLTLLPEDLLLDFAWVDREQPPRGQSFVVQSESNGPGRISATAEWLRLTPAEFGRGLTVITATLVPEKLAPGAQLSAEIQVSVPEETAAGRALCRVLPRSPSLLSLAPNPEAEPTPPVLKTSDAQMVRTMPDLAASGLAFQVGFGEIRSVRCEEEQFLLVTGTDAVAVVDLEERAVIWRVDGPVDCAALLPSRRLLAVAHRETVCLWDLATGRVERTLGGASRSFTALAISPDAKTLAAGSASGSIALWSLPGRDGPTLLNHGARVTGLAFSRTGQLLSAGGRLRVWENGVETKSLSLPDSTAHTFGPDGSIIFCQGNRVQRLLPRSQYPDTFFAAPDTLALAAVSAQNQGIACVISGERVLVCWNDTWEVLLTLETDRLPTDCAAIALGTDLRTVGISRAAPETAMTWSVTQGQVTLHPPVRLPGAVEAISVSPCLQFAGIYTVGSNRLLHVVEIPTGIQIRSLPLSSAVAGAAPAYQSLAVSSGGKLAAIATRAAWIDVSDVQTGELLAARPCATPPVGLSIPDARTLHIAHAKFGHVDLEVEHLPGNGKAVPPRRQLNTTPGRVVMTGDLTRIAVWNRTDPSVTVMSVPGRRALRTIETGQLISSAAFDPTGAHLGVLSATGVLRFWKIAEPVAPREAR